LKDLFGAPPPVWVPSRFGFSLFIFCKHPPFQKTLFDAMADNGTTTIKEGDTKPVFNGRVQFDVALPPRTKERPVFCFKKKGPMKVVNRSARNENAFLKASKESIEKALHDPKYPLFKKDELMSIKVITRRRRPNRHYVNGNRERGMLKACFKGDFKPTDMGGDADNYVKLVQDALQCTKGKTDGLYLDDRKFVFSCGVKVWDDEGTCEGGTTVIIDRVDDQDYLKRLFYGNQL
jgi:Holliday junction resolvase RusA-like endonuclease